MFTVDECKARFLQKLHKEYKDLTLTEKAILADVIDDCSYFGRYSKFLMWGTNEREGFLNWLKQMNVEYPELTDAERWAYEDAFGS